MTATHAPPLHRLARLPPDGDLGAAQIDDAEDAGDRLLVSLAHPLYPALLSIEVELSGRYGVEFGGMSLPEQVGLRELLELLATTARLEEVPDRYMRSRGERDYSYDVLIEAPETRARFERWRRDQEDW